MRQRAISAIGLWVALGLCGCDVRGLFPSAWTVPCADRPGSTVCPVDAAAPPPDMTRPCDPRSGSAHAQCGDAYRAEVCLPSGACGPPPIDACQPAGDLRVAFEYAFIPAGSLLLGDLHQGLLTYPVCKKLTTIPLPFCIGTDEVTVGDYRRYLALGADGGRPTAGLPVTSDANPDCTYTRVAGANEGRPLNCVTQDQATAFCQALNGTAARALPSEAEWTWVAGRFRPEAAGAGQQLLRPWYSFGANTNQDPGTVRDTFCGHVNLALCTDGGGGLMDVAAPQLDLGSTPGPGSGFQWPKKPVRNLMGNVSEWIYGAVLWKDGFWDALCTDYDALPNATGDSSVRRIVKGGDWRVSEADARNALQPGYRNPILDPYSPTIGFRCYMKARLQ